MDEPRNELDEEPGVFDFVGDAADEASVRRGEADFEAGRVVSHAAVKRWLLSLSTPNPLPRPKWGE
ncbi:MAG: CopG family transcriptional regulator [Brevundimonas sp.]